jgi:hypothetical protein
MEPMKRFMFIALSTAVALAQAPAPVGTTVRLDRPGLPATVQLISAANIGPVIAGAPYSADAVNEVVQMLADGNRIVDRTTTKQYRDSQGRERRELGSMITISDPIAKVSYTLHPDTKTAEKMDSNGRNFFFFSFNNSEHLPIQRTQLLPSNPPMPAVAQRLQVAVAPQLGAISDQGPTELLPARTIEGVQANGTKTVRTIPAGAIGNERPIEIVDETWTAPELGVTILTTHSDPRTGTTTYKLTNINRSEPPRSLFEVPPDYTLTEGPAIRLQKKQE